MNLKFYAMAVVLSFLPLIQSYAGAQRGSLREIDFSHTEEFVQGPDSLIEFDLIPVTHTEAQKIIAQFNAH